jgi:hypothetical protein
MPFSTQRFSQGKIRALSETRSIYGVDLTSNQ